MDAKLIALKLILDDLDIPASIDTIDDRKRVQKAVYLGQLAGVKLGYRFGWYLKGPYSSDLTKDYYSLAEAIEMGDSDYDGKTLQSTVSSRLANIKPLLNVPEAVPLSQEDWLELVSSVHYLKKISKHDKLKIREVLSKEKPLLVTYFDAAEAALKEVQLID